MDATILIQNNERTKSLEKEIRTSDEPQHQGGKERKRAKREREQEEESKERKKARREKRSFFT
uniref:Uncharacterized protein n=1 Tax=Octopus bimaculoides TaxID=37653 RepID=A0A0L8FSE1_OCTBM